jgi:hypothetical protein
MADFSKVEVADEKLGIYFPVKGAPGMQVQRFSSECNGLCHLLKGTNSGMG